MTQEMAALRIIIRRVCKHLGFWSHKAEELLMFTAAHESEGGKHRRQLGGGPALGVFQMEPATFYDIRENYLRYRSALMQKIRELGNVYNPSALVNNDHLAAGMARVHYLRAPEALPEATPEDMAKYWGRYYQTQSDSAKEAKAIADYFKYIKGEG